MAAGLLLYLTEFGSNMGQKTVDFAIEIGGREHRFKAKQLLPIPAMLLQATLQKDLAPLLFTSIQANSTEQETMVSVQGALSSVTEETIQVLLHKMVFASEVMFVSEKMVKLDEALFNLLFSGNLLAAWELIVQILLLNYKDFILALPAKVQALVEKGVQKQG